MDDLTARFARDGFVVFDHDPRVARWAAAALPFAIEASRDPKLRETWMRQGGTWFVGVDVLPNGADGAIGGMPLEGPWDRLVAPPPVWHPAQVSVTYPGYPRQDATESDAAHRFRLRRDAAHVDGLHLEAGRRILREAHMFILGTPLNESDASPLVVWRGSHRPMAAALTADLAPEVIGTDVTEAYTQTRAEVFESCARVEVRMRPGQAVLLDRFLLHGVAPWRAGMRAPSEGRMIAYFRPEFEKADDWRHT
ncbi:hypothetical protein [Thalassorhabdomicrobium marinisediminis]|uniref:hypothetical protein n=1 Tax=Thalassorhabdomicrobium marinisediminis TaxID=2170577 RepID=UPI00249097E9|nr:hypothetical protein [Thalassorhabdomicrobium marinisediminis]